jgi:NAD(P)-dependent dehydrogenase (short-subunit alcohol dehydrogenase family)
VSWIAENSAIAECSEAPAPRNSLAAGAFRVGPLPATRPAAHMNIGDELKGIAALVTGASRGIGRATAFALARHGARLLVHFNNPLDQAREVVMGIRAEGGDSEAVRGELSTHAGSVDLAQTVRTLVDGKLDILLANAGISKAGSLEAHSEADLDRLFATKVKSPCGQFIHPDGLSL